MTEQQAEVARIQAALAAYYDPRDVEFKPQSVSKDGTRALAIAYVDARVVQDRLDQVMGLDGWQDDYTFLPDGCVVCTLRLRICGEWITKTDVGGESDQKDPGDRRKAAVSDSLKRAAVKFGAGRYLYDLPSDWYAYDSNKRCFKQTPTLPEWALPGQPTKAEARAPRPAERTQPAAPPAAKRLKPIPTRPDDQGIGEQEPITGEMWIYLQRLAAHAGILPEAVLQKLETSDPKKVTLRRYRALVKELLQKLTPAPEQTQAG